MELSVSRKPERNRAIRLSLAAVAAAGIVIAALVLSGDHAASGPHPGARPAVQAPTVSEPTLSGECLNAQPLEGSTC